MGQKLFAFRMASCQHQEVAQCLKQRRYVPDPVGRRIIDTQIPDQSAILLQRGGHQAGNRLRMENSVFLGHGFPELLHILDKNALFFIKIRHPAGDQIERKILKHHLLRFDPVGTPFVVIVHLAVSYVEDVGPVGGKKTSQVLQDLGDGGVNIFSLIKRLDTLGDHLIGLQCQFKLDLLFF